MNIMDVKLNTSTDSIRTTDGRVRVICLHELQHPAIEPADMLDIAYYRTSCSGQNILKQTAKEQRQQCKCKDQIKDDSYRIR